MHDNFGSLLATLKLNFQNLKRQDTQNEVLNKLYAETDILLEEAYQKVCFIAQTKNAGVIAKEGFLKAVKNIVEKANFTGKFKVEVIFFGLKNRLENILEVTIFRLIQEILTNAIEHAQATEINIHLTQHDEFLNI